MASRGMRRGHLGSPDLLASPGFGSRPPSDSVGSWKNEVSGQWSVLLSSWRRVRNYCAIGPQTVTPGDAIS
jgi:hypothetical protein